jgi:hypothetical protein
MKIVYENRLPEKIKKRTNANESKKDVVTVKKMFVLDNKECCNVEDYRVETLAEENLQAVIKRQKIPLSRSTY